MPTYTTLRLVFKKKKKNERKSDSNKPEYIHIYIEAHTVFRRMACSIRLRMNRFFPIQTLVRIENPVNPLLYVAALTRL